MIRNLLLRCLGGPINKEGRQALRGPAKSSFRAQSFKVCGGTLSFSCPSASPVFEGSEGKCINTVLGKVNDLRRFGNNVLANDDWRELVFFMRHWGFFGRRFQRAVGETKVSIQVLGKLRDDQSSDLSLFHPRAFEGEIAEFLNDAYGFRFRQENDPLYQAPVNWETATIGDVNGALFEVHSVDQGRQCDSPMFKLMFPVSDSSFVQVTIIPNVPRDTDRVKYDILPMTDFVFDILRSFEFTLSPENKNSWISTKQTCESMELSRNFAPLKWPIKPGQSDVTSDRFQLVGDKSA